jgi:hypothetical protein
MSQNYGREVPAPHRQATHRQAARYLVLIDSGGTSLARLFLATREQVAEFDAGAEEVASLIRGVRSGHGADGPAWNQALEGHSAQERREALVYDLQPASPDHP